MNVVYLMRLRMDGVERFSKLSIMVGNKYCKFCKKVLFVVNWNIELGFMDVVKLWNDCNMVLMDFWLVFFFILNRIKWLMFLYSVYNVFIYRR